LAVRLRPDPLGSFSVPPDPLAAIKGGVLLLRGRGGKGRGKERKKKGEGIGKGRVRGGYCLLFINFLLWA